MSYGCSTSCAASASPREARARLGLAATDAMPAIWTGMYALILLRGPALTGAGEAGSLEDDASATTADVVAPTSLLHHAWYIMPLQKDCKAKTGHALFDLYICPGDVPRSASKDS